MVSQRRQSWGRTEDGRRKSARASFVKTGETELSFTSEDVDAFWSSIASHEYEDANATLGDTHTQRFSISIPRIKLRKNGRLLNLWSRQGEMIPMLRTRFPHAEILNAEISRVMLDQARNRFPEETFVCSDLRTIDCPDAYFDAVLSLEMLEHSPSPQRILCEFQRVLKPGGQLVLTCPSAAVEAHLWVADTFLGNHGEGPHRFPSTSCVKRMLKDAGFALAEHRATLFIPPELGRWLDGLNRLCERMCQWFPVCEFGVRQLYEAYKPNQSTEE